MRLRLRPFRLQKSQSNSIIKTFILTIAKLDNNNENNYNQIARRLNIFMPPKILPQQLKTLMILWFTDNPIAQQYK